MLIFFVAALHDIAEDTSGNLPASFRNHRVMWIASCIVAVLVMRAEPLEAVSPNFNAWTIRVAKFMGMVTAATYITQSSNLFANDKQREQHRRKISSSSARVKRMRTRRKYL